ncbi:MAG TPA: LysE/ArgO family amino acid transporter [Dongiaceae bacterium]|nr:LysE/ArgO family amino acid transporter [Dongiaceae bacterium]
MEFVLKGALISGGLIIAIGAQNAFVLKQGLLRNHIFWVSLTCFLCDFLLMTVGVLGLGTLINSSVWLTLGLAVFGALFLLGYGIRSFRSAFTSSNSLHESVGQATQSSVKKIWLSTLAVTLLNPHVYLDTVVIIGGVAGTLSIDQKIQFLLGASLASLIWFMGIGYGARLLLPLFENPKAWRVLEFLIGLIMTWIAFELLRYAAHHLPA